MSSQTSGHHTANSHDDLLLEDISALASLVDGAWNIARHSAGNTEESWDDAQREQALNEWSALRASVLNQTGRSPLLKKLQERFGLSQWQLALLCLCALPQLDPRYQAVYADLHPAGQPVPCLELLLNILSAFPQRKRQWLGELLSDSPLLKWRLLILPEGAGLSEPYLLTSPVSLAPDLLRTFMSASTIHDTDSAGGCLSRIPPCQHACPPITSDARLLTARLVQLSGEEGSGRHTLALSIAAHRPLLEMDGERLLQHSESLQTLSDCLRQVILADGELVWPDGLEPLQNKPALATRLSEWLALPGNRCWFIESKTQPWPVRLASSHPVSLDIDRPDITSSSAIWSALAEHYLELAKHCPSDFWQTVARSYQLMPGAIVQIMLALQKTLGAGNELTTELVLQECLEKTPISLSGLATRVQPVYSLDDVIVNADARIHINEILQRYRQRQQLHDQKLSSTLGLHVLFWGKPGTGKTMAAEALADELKLPLYKANLASISSKWIGETEKHLASLFDDAERHNGLLFFDEADAVFSRRSQVESSHDKNANLGVSYLLQRMERYNGLLVLATNFKGNLDPAFMRRMHFSLEFTQPDAGDRLQLWQHWLGKVETGDDLDPEWLANELELSGAQIRNIVQHSASQALGRNTGKISRELLARAIYRESQKNDNSFLISTRLAGWHDLRQPVQEPNNQRSEV